MTTTQRIIRFLLCLILAAGGGTAAARATTGTPADSLLTPRRQSIVRIASATGRGDLEA